MARQLVWQEASTYGTVPTRRVVPPLLGRRYANQERGWFKQHLQSQERGSWFVRNVIAIENRQCQTRTLLGVEHARTVLVSVFWNLSAHHKWWWMWVLLVIWSHWRAITRFVLMISKDHNTCVSNGIRVSWMTWLYEGSETRLWGWLWPHLLSRLLILVSTLFQTGIGGWDDFCFPHKQPTKGDVK